MLTVLRRPDFRLLFAGLCASMLGESVLLLALAIWVKELTGSDGAAGATILAIVAPTFVAPLVGVVVDRYRRRPFLIAANLVTAAMLTPLFLVRGHQQLWIIYTVGVLYGLSNLAVNAGLSGLIKEVVPGELLADANGALQTVRQGLRLGGPLLGAALYTQIGGWMLAVVAMTGFLIATVSIAMMRVPESALVRLVSEPADQHWLAEAAAGLRHIWHTPAIRHVLIGFAGACTVFGFTESLIFAVVDEGFHRPAGFVSIIVTVQGIGGLLGGLAAARVVRRIGEIATSALGLALFAPVCFAFTRPSLVVSFPLVALAGAGLPLSIVGFTTLLQRATPEELMGRVSAAAEAAVTGPQTLSIGIGAILVSLLPYQLVWGAMGIVLTLAAGYLWIGRSLTPPTPIPELALEQVG